MDNHELLNSVPPDPWAALREVTSARIAIGRSGGSLPTREWLSFKAAHAAARDAVHCPFDAEQLAADIRTLGASVVTVATAAADRREFLQRPDLGRCLNEQSRHALDQLRTEPAADLTIIVSDGLSAIAAHRQCMPLLESLLPMLHEWQLAPIVVAGFGRVALEDEVGELLGSQLALMLIGERPGLSSPDSLGAYLVYGPRIANSDAQRNCVSNIRPQGLSHAAAAETIFYLLNEARRLSISGVALKDQRSVQTGKQIPS